MNIVQTEWREKNAQGDEFRKILNKIIDALSETKTSVILADARRMTLIWKDDREWIVKEWYPKAIKAGFRCQALIVTEDSFNELSIKSIVEHYDDHVVETAYFTSFSDAFVWVKSKMPSNASSS